ncbi:RNA polymerase sigma factor sigF, chloroplastic isoform X2 [Phalaenopsis equestris]|uniref:RNA polymerase sigma factor sigF, chloroplastic isoform X2 n=1 Tax=Phalaenopsis equestris TaxID=78828 RepID=UPI0009E5E505|nr:RNA polymerase sigma factor sigF, chloroplastic isoform X2 [Phalaenopsis equestris]
MGMLNWVANHVQNRLKSSNEHGVNGVVMLHGQTSRAIISAPTKSAVRHFPTFILTQVQHNGYDNSYGILEKKVTQAMLDLQSMEDSSLSLEERERNHFDLYMKHLECCLLCHPGLWYSFLTTYNLEYPVKRTREVINQNITSTTSPEDVLDLAKRALMACQDAALLADKSNIFLHELVDKTLVPRESVAESMVGLKEAVRSKKFLERKSKKRKELKKSNSSAIETSAAMGTDKVKRIEKTFDNKDPLRLFLWGPETKKLLTIAEEKDLIARIQDLMGVDAIKKKLHMQFGREPTLMEWAESVGMSFHDLQSCISSGINSRNKVLYANFRLVIHIAKQYEGKGLDFQDLLQVGSMGLMKSLEKFKPQIGCRFSTYAYWWIRQSIRKAIFQHSRTIRLPENVFAELKRIKDAKRIFLQEGQTPTSEELAKRAGMHVGKLENLLKMSRNPISIQAHTWTDQEITLQEITADPEIETPKIIVEKQMMRQHVQSLLGVLSPRERKLIRLRFGIQYSEPKSLQQIGDMFGISKERVRQLECQALNKMRACCTSLGFRAYAELLM